MQVSGCDGASGWSQVASCELNKICVSLKRRDTSKWPILVDNDDDSDFWAPHFQTNPYVYDVCISWYQLMCIWFRFRYWLDTSIFAWNSPKQWPTATYSPNSAVTLGVPAASVRGWKVSAPAVVLVSLTGQKWQDVHRFCRKPCTKCVLGDLYCGVPCRFSQPCMFRVAA